MDAKVQRLAESAGLAEWSTGGGCMALGRELANGGTVMITDAEDTVVVPTSADAPVMVGWSDADGYAVLQVILPNLLNALQALEWGPETIPADLLPGDTVVWTETDFWDAERLK